MQLDDALYLLGAYGRYQILIYLAISVLDNLPSIWHMSSMAFLGYEATHKCKVPDGAEFNKTIPSTEENGHTGTYGKCYMYPYNNGTYGNDTVKCTHGWEYEQEPIKSSIVTEWDLVCDKNVLPETSIMVFNFGVMFGAIVFGFMSDKFGRKKCFIFALVAQSVIGSLAAVAPNFIIFTALRFFVGALEQGVNITGFIMATELFPPKERTILAVAHEFLWGAGGALLPIFAYFLRTWRPLQLTISLPSILGIIFIWTIPESLVWLLAKGKIKEAEAIVKKAAKFNNKTVPDNIFSDHVIRSPTTESKPILENGTATEIKGDTKTYTVLDLYKTPVMRKITICTSTLWALNTMVYFGLSYNTPNLYGDMYLNFFIGQMVEIPSVAITMWVIYKWGRRWPFCLFHVFGGLVCIASPFIPAATASGYDLTWVSVTLAMLGKFAINSSFTIIYIYGPEIYPTVVRNTGAGIGSCFGRIGGILYPYINYLSKLNTPFAKQLPLLVFGILSVIGGFVVLPLPETRQRPLPETIDDVEHYDEFCKRMQEHEAKRQAEKAEHELNLIVDGKVKKGNDDGPGVPL